MELFAREVVCSTNEGCSIQGAHRVLHTSKVSDRVWLIAIPKIERGTQFPRYFKGEFVASYRRLSDEGDAETLVKLPLVKGHPLEAERDDRIRDRYPARVDPNTGEPYAECKIVRQRSSHWTLVEGIATFAFENPVEAYENGGLAVAVQRRIDELRATSKYKNIQKRDLLDPLHRILALGLAEASLLGGTPFCGGAGKPRVPRQVEKLGRTSRAFAEGKVPSSGIHLSDEEALNAATARKILLKQGKTEEEAFLLISGTYWSNGTKVVDGVEVPILLPSWQRPTRPQVKYSPRRHGSDEAAFRYHFSDSDWERDHRAMLGSATDGISAAFQEALLDFTGTHVTFVSQESRLKAIGPGYRVLVHEGFSDVVTGLYCGLRPPSERTILLAIYNSASDKTEFFKRFRVDITRAQIPEGIYKKGHYDNGEGRNFGTFNALASLGMTIEMVPRRRPDLDSQVEAGNRAFHSQLDNKIDGKTRGKPRARGEDHSAIPACWTYYDYVSDLLRGIRYRNCFEDASAFFDRHPLRSEMLRAGVPPFRIDMLNWAIRTNHYMAPTVDVERVKVVLLPEYRGIVNQRGIFVVRPDCGKRKDVISGLRYSGPVAMERGWHEGTRSAFQIPLRIEDGDPSVAWYIDEFGQHRLERLSLDETSKREHSVDDLIAIQDFEASEKGASQSALDQASSDRVVGIEHTNSKNRRAKKREIAASGGNVSKAQLKKDLGANREREQGLLDRQLDPISQMPRESEMPSPSKAASPALEPSQTQEQPLSVGRRAARTSPSSTRKSSSPIDKGLAAYRKSRR